MPTNDNSFYISGGTLHPDAPSYVERQADTDLFQALQRGEFCYVLTSRQMGKSSLMARTAARLRDEGTHVVVLDLSAMGENLTPEQWYLGLLEVVGRRLDLEDELETFWLAHETIGPLRRWMRAVREVVLPALGVQVFRCSDVESDCPSPPEHLNTQTPEHPPRLVIFIDEIDCVRSLPFSTDEFFAAIRECYNRRSEDPEFARLTFCLVGVATPSDLIRDPHTTPFNIGRRIELHDFTEAEAALLRTGLALGTVDTRGRSEAEARVRLERILYWTNGHPYLTQRLCQAVVEEQSSKVERQRSRGEAQGSSPSDPSPFAPRDATALVDRLCEGLFLSARAREQDTNLLFVRDWLLRSEADRAGLLDLYGQVRRGRQLSADNTNPLVETLRLSGIIRTRLANSLTVSNRIYERVFDRSWVAQHMPDAEVRRQKAAYRRGLWRAAGLASGIVALLGGLAIYALRQRNAAIGNAQRVERVLQQTQSLLYAADLNVAAQYADTPNFGPMHTLLDAHRPQPGEIDRRGFEWFYLWRLGHSELFTLPHPALIAGPTAFSPDGKWLATGCADGSIRLWDAHTGHRLQSRPGHQGEIRAISFSPDGHNLATVSRKDQLVIVWKLPSVSRSRTLTMPGRILDLSLDGQIAAVDGGGGVITLHDTRTGRVLHALASDTDVSRPITTAFSPDSTTLATVRQREAGVTFWNVKTGQAIGRLGPCSSRIESLTFSPEGQYLATGHFDGSLTLWEISNGRQLRTIPAHSVRIRSLAFSPDGRRLASGSMENTSKIWDVDSGKLIRICRGRGGGAWPNLTFSPDTTRLATSGWEGSVQMWDVSHASRRTSLCRSGLPPAHIAFSRDGNCLAIGSRDSLRLWDLGSGRDVWALTDATIGSASIAVSPDGNIVATGGIDGTVRLWDMATGRAKQTMPGNTARIVSIAFSPDGRLLATGSFDNTARLWSVSDGRQVIPPYRLPARVLAVTFSPDGKTLAVGSGDDKNEVHFLDTTTGGTVRTLPGLFPAVSALAYSPDGRFLAVAGYGGSYAIWNLVTGRSTSSLKVAPLTSIAFSHDGQRLVTGDTGGAIRLWDVSTNREILVLRGLELDTWVAFSRDGLRLASGDMSGRVRVWEAAGREEVATREAQERASMR